MIVYQYSTETGEYLNPFPCQANPKHPGEYLLPPANTLPIKPPATKNEAAIINETKNDWLVVPDYRGYEYYLPDGSFHEIKELGITPPDDALEEPPEPDAEQRCTNACTAIDAAAGTARASFATNSTFIESEYNRTYQLTVNWIDSGYKDEAPKPVKSHAEAYDVSEQQAAEEIKHMGDLWFDALDEIRDIRLKAKQHIMNLDEDADHTAEAQQYINQLNQIRP